MAPLRTSPVAGWTRRVTSLLLAAVLALALSGAVADASSRAQQPRTIAFSGYTWQVKSSTDVVGPGPNYFSDSGANVWVDQQGRLHLKLTSSKGRWYCAEVVNMQSLGRGRYGFELDSAVNALDPNVVLGLFTWSDDPAYANRELDVEFSRWGNAADPTNAQYVVQPYEHPGTCSGSPSRRSPRRRTRSTGARAAWHSPARPRRPRPGPTRAPTSPTRLRARAAEPLALPRRRAPEREDGRDRRQRFTFTSAQG